MALHNSSLSRPVLPDYIQHLLPDKMPSTRAISGFALSALGAAQSVLGMRSPIMRELDTRASASCPANGQVSCQNTTVQTDLCCFNAPGGLLLQTQFWDTNPQTGPVDSWTIHGLWPDNCDGTYDANCDSSRAYTNITQILQAAGQNDLLSYMDTYWPDYQGDDESFWEHEWAKHGTCISTLDPDCYTNYQPTEEVPDFFNTVVNLFKTLPTYKWLSDAGITPSSDTTYTVDQIQDALSQQHGGQVYIGCENGALDEIWYFYNVQGSVQSGTFDPTDVVGKDTSCSSSAIMYLPKTSSDASPTSTATATATSVSPTSTSSPGSSFSGSGTMNVVSGGSQNGCIISKGTWYTSGTCATFTATASGSGFTLKSSKGLCAIASGALTCSSSVSTGTVFSSSGSNLVYNGASTFHADGVPSGSTQGTVYTSSSHSTSLTIQWASK